LDADPGHRLRVYGRAGDAGFWVWVFVGGLVSKQVRDTRSRIYGQAGRQSLGTAYENLHTLGFWLGCRALGPLLTDEAYRLGFG
jgi:hypothetical protein